MFEARSRRAGGALLERTVRPRIRRGPSLIQRQVFWSWQAGERKVAKEKNPLKNGRTGGGAEEKIKHVPPLRSLKDPALHLRSCLTSA